MNKFVKRVLIFIFVFIGLIALGYGAYRFYNFLISDATRKIREGVAGSMNPLGLVGKLFGGK